MVDMVQRQEVTWHCFLWDAQAWTGGIVATDLQPLAENFLRSRWSEVLSAQATPSALDARKWVWR
jgi:hypothetical protein